MSSFEENANKAMCIHLVSNIVLVGLLPDFLEDTDVEDDMFMLEDPLIFSTVTRPDGSVLGQFTEVAPYGKTNGADCIGVYRQQILGSPYPANDELANMYFSAIGNKMAEPVPATADGSETIADSSMWSKG